MLLVDFDGVRVALVPWPSEADALDGEPADRPRLLLVATDSEPPGGPRRRRGLDPGAGRRPYLEVRARRLARIATARRSPDNGVGRAARPSVTIARAGSHRA